MVKMSIYSRTVFRGIFNRRGISLIAVMIVMLIVATLALLIASMMSTGNISSVTDMQAQQAFYLAQAGMEWYMEQLENDSDWSSPPTVKTDQAFGAGTFTVTYSNEAEDSIDVQATGKVTGWNDNTVQRVIIQHMQKADFEDFVAFFNGGDGTIETGIKKDQTITGDIFINGAIDIDRDCTITGNVLATGGVSVGSGTTISGTTTEYTSLPTAQLTLDTTYYDNLITTASGEPSGNVKYEDETISGTIYVDGKVELKGVITISGSATIVATDEIKIKSDAVVGDNLTLISSGTVKAEDDSTVGINAIFYSSSKIEIQDTVTISSGAGVGEGAVLLSPDEVKLKDDDITIVGFIFAGDEVKIEGKRLDLTGSIAGNELTKIEEDGTLILDTTKVDISSIEGFSVGVTTIIINSSWQESL